MADTARGDYPDLICSDCGEKGCSFKYLESRSPSGETVPFCTFCYEQREERQERGEESLLLGVKPSGIPEKFAGRVLGVKTESGSFYSLKPIEGKKDECIIFRRNKKPLHFSKARVICLKIGESMVLKPRNGCNTGLWSTTSVEKIKPC